jgi:hypothetical protein
MDFEFLKPISLPRLKKLLTVTLERRKKLNNFIRAIVKEIKEKSK